jgi:hypothetical protein
LSQQQEGFGEDGGPGQHNTLDKAIRAEEREDGNSNSLFTSLADIAMDRDNEAGDDYGIRRTFKTDSRVSGRAFAHEQNYGNKCDL